MAAVCCTCGLRNLYLFRFSFQLYAGSYSSNCGQNNLEKLEGSLKGQKQPVVAFISCIFLLFYCFTDTPKPAKSTGQGVVRWRIWLQNV